MANANPAYYLSRVPGGAAYKGCRQVATFNGVSQYVSIPSVTLSGDFEISLYFQHSLKTCVLLGSSTETSQIRLDANTNDRIRVILNGDFDDFSNALTGLVVDQFYNLRIIKTGTTIEIFIDDVSKGTNFNNTTPTFDAISQLGTGILYYDKSVLDLKIWTEGDRNTGLLVRNYPINDGYVNNPVVRDLASNQDGTAINFTEATWSGRCDL